MSNEQTPYQPNPQKACKVSICMPMYCCENYVDGVLESLCSQDLDDIEILCVVDGSPDATLSKVQAWEQKDARVTMLWQEHAGAGAARNTALAKARGDYLMFLDADDIFTPAFMSTMYNAVVSHNADIAVCLYVLHDEKHGVYLRKQGFDYQSLPANKPVNAADNPNIMNAIDVISHNKIFKHSFIKENTLRFSETESINDVFFCAAALVCATRVMFIPEELYTYRKHHNKMSISTHRGKFPYDLIAVYRELYEFIAQHGAASTHTHAFSKKWRNSLFYYAQYTNHDTFIDNVVAYLAESQPWATMTNRQLHRQAGLDSSFAKFMSGIHQKHCALLQKRGGNTSTAKWRYDSSKNQAECIDEIRRRLYEQHGRGIKAPVGLLQAAIWKVQDIGLHHSFRVLGKHIGDFVRTIRNT